MTAPLTEARLREFISKCHVSLGADEALLQSVVAAARAGLRSEWQPISTAPKDGTVIDLWVITSHNPQGHRVPGAHRSYDGGKYPDVWIDANGRYANFSRYFDLDEGEDCLELGNVAHPKAKGWIKATHWLPLPQPPLQGDALATPSHEEGNATTRRERQQMPTGDNERRLHDIPVLNDSRLRDAGSHGRGDDTVTPPTPEALKWDNGRKPADHPPIRMMSAAEGVERGFIGYDEKPTLEAQEGEATNLVGDEFDTLASHLMDDMGLEGQGLPGHVMANAHDALAKVLRCLISKRHAIGLLRAKPQPSEAIAEDCCETIGNSNFCIRHNRDIHQCIIKAGAGKLEGQPRPSEAIAEGSEIGELVARLTNWPEETDIVPGPFSKAQSLMEQAATALEASEIEKEKWRAEADCHRHERNIVNSKLTQAMGEIAELKNDVIRREDHRLKQDDIIRDIRKRELDLKREVERLRDESAEWQGKNIVNACALKQSRAANADLQREVEILKRKASERSAKWREAKAATALKGDG